MNNNNAKVGYVAIIGRPNVGKSTLLNHLLEQKISITSRKPQTTRNAVLGIKTQSNAQMIFVDTPGIHQRQTTALNHYMNKTALAVLRDVDVLVFVVDKDQWTEEDQWIASQLTDLACPVLVAVNKLDQLANKEAILPILPLLAGRVPAAEIVPIAALKNLNLDLLEELIIERLPEGEHLFDPEQLTDRSERFLVAELIREKIMRQLGDELPYQTAVEIEAFTESENLVDISARIFVERDGQKRILIGEKGERLKQIGQQARKDMETLLQKKVMLRLWVKVRSGWSDDSRALRSLGYGD